MPPRTIPRPVARILLVDSGDRVLLFWTELAYGSFWLTPGGGLEAGESYEEAARRELWEETGLRDVELGPCIWTVRFTFPYEDAQYDQSERYYLARVPAFDLSSANWQDEERLEIQEHHWWSLEEITVSSDRFRPDNLAQLLPAILSGVLPEEPLLAPFAMP